MPLYDHRLNALVAVAETGSFNKAAERLHLAVPSLAKQIDSLEAELRLKLFERSRSGCVCTDAGKALVEDTRMLMRLSDDALARARRAASAGDAVVRLGISYLSPAQKTLDCWGKVHAAEPELKLELVPIEDIYDEKLDVMGGLGRDVDLIQAAYSSRRWRGRCQALPLGSARLSVDLPRQSPLARSGPLAPSDLAGIEVRILTDAFDGVDEATAALEAAGARIVPVDRYDLGTFNEVAEEGGAILTCGAWSGLHPSLATVPLALDLEAPCALLYPLDPSPAVQRFVNALEHVLSTLESAPRERQE